MRSSLLLAALILAGAANGSAASWKPDPEEVFRLTLARPRSAYEGECEVQALSGGKTETRIVRVRFAPPDRYRREILDASGKTRMLVVSDGRQEWVYDVRRAAAWKGAPADPDYKLQDPDEEVALIRRNYDLRMAGTESVAGRQAAVLEVVSRRSGKPARKLWVDEDGLVLQRRTFSEDGLESSWMKFTKVGTLPKAVGFGFSPPDKVRVLVGRWQPDYMEIDEAEAASGVKLRLPAWLPPGYAFESVNVMPFKGASLLHTRFSDGIDALSLFQYPRDARLRLGWSRLGRPKTLRLGGARARLVVTADGKVLEWRTESHRFVLIGPLSVESMRRMAESVQEK